MEVRPRSYCAAVRRQAWARFKLKALERLGWRVGMILGSAVVGTMVGVSFASALKGALAGVGGALLVALLFFVWRIFAAPGELHAEQEDKIRDLDALANPQFPDIELTVGEPPVVEPVDQLIGSATGPKPMIFYGSLTVCNRSHQRRATLDLTLRILFAETAYLELEPVRSGVSAWEGLKKSRFETHSLLSFPLNLSAAESVTGYLAFNAAANFELGILSAIPDGGLETRFVVRDNVTSKEREFPGGRILTSAAFKPPEDPPSSTASG